MTIETDTQATRPLTNDEIADHLEQIADFLELQEANPHRVRAYRTGAKSVRTTAKNIAQLASHDHEQQNGETLEDLPGIGRGLAWLIGELVQTGHTGRLDRLRGELRAEDRFRRVPGVGNTLAKRIVETLGIDTLPALEMAAHDGRLRTVEGFGNRRVQAVRAALGTMLTRASRHRQQGPTTDDQPLQPPAKLLLAVDGQYRAAAAAGKLRTIAPRRFNPNNEAWLPILHTEAAGWDFTALFSNTARAHELNKTDDWVVIYFDQDGHADGNGHDGQCTVVTETTGALKGKRVIRGREGESRQYYDAQKATTQETERHDG